MNQDNSRIILAHGNGGKLQADLLANWIFPEWRGVVLPADRDSQIMPWSSSQLVMSTDSFVVDPLFFPGGDIGHLAVCGTTNDLAMSGAEPRFLMCSFILEEGLPLNDLRRVARSIGQVARELKLQIVGGDLKVVERGKGDGMFINTSGVGCLRGGKTPGPERLRPGQRVLVSGDLGRHGLVVLLSREGIQFTSELQSDCAPLWPAVRALQDAAIDLKCLRDLTRGGLATALHELAQSSEQSFLIHENHLPLLEPARGACEVLGIEAVYLASEGTMLVVVDEEDVARTLEILRARSGHQLACEIGQVVSTNPDLGPETRLQAEWGAPRRLGPLLYEALPRIC